MTVSNLVIILFAVQPVYPDGQSQMGPETPSVQWEPCWHGAESQKSLSSHRLPFAWPRHRHLKVFARFWHTPANFTMSLMLCFQHCSFRQTVLRLKPNTDSKNQIHKFLQINQHILQQT